MRGPSFFPVVCACCARPGPSGRVFRQQPSPQFNSKRNMWPLWKEKFTSLTKVKGCRNAYTETPNPVRVADDFLTNEDLLLRYSASTIVHARMA